MNCIRHKRFSEILGLMWWSTKSCTRYACSNIGQNTKHREHPDGPWLAKSWMVPIAARSQMIDFPLALSRVQKLLRQTFLQHFHPHSWNLNLHAWRDFSFGCSVAHKISEVSELLPPSDISTPPPPRRLHTAPQLSPCLSAPGHSSPYNFVYKI